MFEQRWCSRQSLPGALGLALLAHSSRMLVSAQGVPYNCNAGFDNWWVDWSNSKKDYCCRHERRGCRYDCKAAFKNWRTAWSEEKKQWCCRFEQLGCGPRAPTTHTYTTTSKAGEAEVEPFPHGSASALDWVRPFGFHKDIPTYTSTTTTTTTILTRTTTFTSTTTTTSFNCIDGLAYYHKTWSPEKSEWCCAKHSKGCRIDPCTVGLRSMRSAWSTNKTQQCCGAWVEQGRWPPFTKNHCCRTTGIGCPTSPTTSTTAKVIPASFDCDVGYENWEEEWSAGKKGFCCLHKARGCSPKATTTTTTSLALDCSAGVNHWEKGWSTFKQDFCCKTQGFPCRQEGKNESTSQDEASPSNDTHAEDIESEQEGGKNKSTAQDEANDTHAEDAGSELGGGEKTVAEIIKAGKARPKWSEIIKAENAHGQRRAKAAEIVVSDTEQYDCSVEHYDCTEGVMDWRTTWSVAKRQWCCAHDLVWCPTDGAANRTHGNSSAAPTPSWSKMKRDWCCKHKNKGCDFDNLNKAVEHKQRELERALEVVGVKADQQQAQQLARSTNAGRMWTAALLGLAAAGVALSLGLAGRARVRAMTRRDIGLLPTEEEANE